MNLGIKNKIVTVQQVYDYALMHNYTNADITVVLDIINRERNSSGKELESIVTPINNTSTTDFSELIEYSIEDLIKLLS